LRSPGNGSSARGLSSCRMWTSRDPLLSASGPGCPGSVRIRRVALSSTTPDVTSAWITRWGYHIAVKPAASVRRSQARNVSQSGTISSASSWSTHLASSPAASSAAAAGASQPRTLPPLDLRSAHRDTRPCRPRRGWPEDRGTSSSASGSRSIPRGLRRSRRRCARRGRSRTARSVPTIRDHPVTGRRACSPRHCAHVTSPRWPVVTSATPSRAAGRSQAGQASTSTRPSAAAIPARVSRRDKA